MYASKAKIDFHSWVNGRIREKFKKWNTKAKVYGDDVKKYRNIQRKSLLEAMERDS